MPTLKHRGLQPWTVRADFDHLLDGHGLDDPVDVHWGSARVRPQADVRLVRMKKPLDHN
jgi:hypothetical protein